jgi:transposase
MSVVRSIQQDLQRTEARLQWVEVTGLAIDEAQQKLDEKFDVIYKLLTQGSEIGSG